MISTLENNLSKAYKKFIESQSQKAFELELDEKADKSDKNPDKMELMKYHMKKKFGITGQALLILTNFSWRVKLERELIEASKSEKKNVEWDNQMNYLTTCVTKAAAYLDKRKKKDIQRKYVVILYNYILLMKYLYELTSNLKNENVRSIDNYEWQKLLKINFVNKKDIMSTNMFQRNRNRNITEEKYIVQMEQLQNKANYGYEYIGVVRYYEKDCRFGIDLTATNKFFKRVLFTDGEVRKNDGYCTIKYTLEYEVLDNIYDKDFGYVIKNTKTNNIG
jgi:hypothetical protein